MWNRGYLKRLQKDLPSWVERGWVTSAGQDAIVKDVSANFAGMRLAPLAFAILGVLLAGTGIVLFFAANWSEMPKLVKLLVLFGGMWGAYVAAGYALAHPDRIANGFAQALLLFGAILFGANINLIAQIYHISGHYPNAILLWSLGALALAWLVRSQPAAVLGLLLLILWSGMEIFAFRQEFHWPFLILWALFVPPIILGKWRFAAVAALLVLLCWDFFIERRFFSVFIPIFGRGQFFLAQASFIAAVGLFLLGVLMERHERFNPLAAIVQRVSLIGALLNLLTMTHSRGAGSGGRRFLYVASNEWTIGILLGLGVVVGLAAFVLLRNRGGVSRGVEQSGVALLAAVAALVLASHLGMGTGWLGLVLIVGFNLLYYACLLWLIYSGYRAGDAFRVNTGFVFFVLGTLYLYFDSFWTLMDRSFFFMVGGVLVFAGGYVIERQRRRLVAQMGSSANEETPA